MNGKPFFDTNVLIYAAVPTDPRSAVAYELLAAGGVIGVQQLNEFISVARRKLKRRWDDIAERLDDIRELCSEPVPLTLTLHETALRIARRYGYGIYDSLSLAAALESGCDTFWSEDLRDGQIIEGLTIRNPFHDGKPFTPR
jgi:predicted nucleic acid-binding protein